MRVVAFRTLLDAGTGVIVFAQVLGFVMAIHTQLEYWPSQQMRLHASMHHVAGQALALSGRIVTDGLAEVALMAVRARGHHHFLIDLELFVSGVTLLALFLQDSGVL
jgi:hypothetical protein